MKWLKRLWSRLCSVTTKVVVCERAVFIDNGKLVYEGPLDNMPPHLRKRYDAMGAEAKKMMKEAEDMVERMMR